MQHSQLFSKKVQKYVTMPLQVLISMFYQEGFSSIRIYFHIKIG